MALCPFAGHIPRPGLVELGQQVQQSPLQHCLHEGGMPESLAKRGHGALGAPEDFAMRSRSLCGPGGDEYRPPSEFELSLGKIIDTLRSDYVAFFERSPTFDIYDDTVVFALGKPFHGVPELRGKRRYQKALNGLRGIARKFLDDGSVRCSATPYGAPYGCDLKVSWTCEGKMLRTYPIYISAISLYSVTPYAVPTDSASGEAPPLHRVRSHTIEFVEIHPPSLRSFLLHMWWQPHVAAEPALAASACFQP